MSKLKQSELAKFREELLKEQHGLCGMCGLPIESDAVLDHDHVTGHCRAVTHRTCNAVEGKLTNWLRRYNVPREEFLTGLLRYYLKDYSSMPLHPKHKTSTEIQISKLRKRMKTLKTARGKEAVQRKIQALKEKL